MLQKHWLRNSIRGIIVFFIFFYSAFFQFIPIKLLHLDQKNLSGSMEVILSVFSSLIVVAILFFVYRKELKKEWKKFTSKFLDNIDTGLKYYLIGLLVMIVSNLILTFAFHSGGANNENAVQEMIQYLPWLMLINAGLIAPFNEEIIFRKALKDVFKNKWIFIFLSFLIFGGMHVISTATTLVDYLYIIPYGALGASFAAAYYKTNTVFTSMTFHMIHNTILTLLSIYII